MRFVAILAGILLVSFGSDTFATIHNVAVGNMIYTPNSVTVSPGDTVRWTWTGLLHSSTSDPSSPKVWNSGLKSTGTFSIVISPSDGPGPFGYHCSLHPTMIGRILVEPPEIVIDAGVDLWYTPFDSCTFSNQFSPPNPPIPPGFFGPGSDPFSGPILMQGLPAPTNPPNSLGRTDAIIRRNTTISLLLNGPPETVPIELVALSLVSCQPITVTGAGGPELWNVQVGLSSQVQQQQGQMTIERSCTDGGTYDAVLPITPRFIFTRINPPPINPPIVLDPLQLILINTQNHWHYGSFPSFAPCQSGPTVTVDHDLNPLTPNVLVGPSTPNFFAGYRGLQCDNANNAVCVGLSRQNFEGPLLRLSSYICGTPPVQFGATCLLDGSCVVTTPSCASLTGSDYKGDGTLCCPDPCILPPLSGVNINQVDYIFGGSTTENSASGRMLIDVEIIALQLVSSSGFLNMYTDEGWVIQNLKFDTSDGVDKLVTYFQITPFDGTDVLSLTAHIELSTSPVVSFGDGLRGLYPVLPFRFSAEGGGDLPTLVPVTPIAPNSITFSLAGLIESLTQPNKSNVETATNQCFPMSIANSLQYLEDRYGLPVPHNHTKGLKGDNTLVGQLDSASNRTAPSRGTGSGVWFVPMVDGKFKYLKDNGLNKKIVNKHQGQGYGGAGNQLPPGDYSSSGSTSKDESVGGKVTFDWICAELAKGEDVEVVFSYDNGAGVPTGGHAVRVFECGKTLGIPWLGYVHDAQQTSTDPGDSTGLECVRAWAVDLDADAIVNLGAANQEIRFAFSESADNDHDGVTDGVDNAPGTFNPGQEDLNGNGIGDVLENGLLQTEPIPSFGLPTAGSEQTSDPYINILPEFPDHKDLWFVGNATNPGGTPRKVAIAFSWFESDTLVLGAYKDTIEIPGGATREIFGSKLLPICPEQVIVRMKAIDGEITNISGNFNHICYPSLLGCCIGLRGNVDCSGDDIVDISDLTALIDNLFISLAPLCCEAEANTDGAGPVDISDLTVLIDNLFISLAPLISCP